MEHHDNDKYITSKEIHWFVQTLKDTFQVIVVIEDIAVEP